MNPVEVPFITVKEALHWGLIVFGSATILLALYRIGLKAKTQELKKSKKKRSIYASPRK